MVHPRRGPFQAGDLVQLTDPKGRHHTVVLEPGKSFFTHRGSLSHDDLIGRPDGSVVVTSSGGTPYVALRPLLADFTLAMKRGAAVVYPKDAAQIVAMADVFPGARVVEAGAGSGALTCWLLRAAGDCGSVTSFERRADFAEIARRNVQTFFGAVPAAWQLVVGDFDAEARSLSADDADRVILDMLAPWDCLETAARLLVPGGVICCYVATTTQLSRTAEAIRAQGQFDEPASWESLVRGLARGRPGRPPRSADDRAHRVPDDGAAAGRRGDAPAAATAPGQGGPSGRGRSRGGSPPG